MGIGVYELVEAARAHERGVDDVGAVGGPDDEDVLLLADAVHLREELVHHAVARAPRVPSCKGFRI